MIISLMRNGIDNETMIYVIAFLFAVLLSISVHEYAHGFVANKMGDDTAKRLGRLTLNPISHLDIFGTLAFFVFGFGWAKPVPINPVKFREYRKGIFLTSVAGIVANMFLAFFSAGFYIVSSRLSLIATIEFTKFITNFLSIFFAQMLFINLQFAIFNLIPIFPLDGFNMVYSLTKERNKFVKFMAMRGTYILIGILIVVSLIEPYLSFLNGQTLMFYLANLIASPMEMFWTLGLNDLLV